MKSLWCTAPHTLEWRALAEATIAPRAALVRPLVVATCDLDGPMIAGETPYRAPFAVGHECIAEVIEVGAQVENVMLGERVIVPFQISCGTCGACTQGQTGNCTSVPPLAMFGFGRAGGDRGGALSDRLVVPFADAMLARLPSALVPTHLAGLADNLPDAYRCVAGPMRHPGGEVLVIGGRCHSIGLYAVDIATVLGASVTYIDPDPRRCERAERLGATVICAPYPERAARRFPVVVDASADERGLASALRMLAPEGTCTSVGGYFTPTSPIPLRDLYLAGGTFRTGRCHARAELEATLALASRLRPELVTSEVAAFDDAPRLLAASPTGKLVFTRA